MEVVSEGEDPPDFGLAKVLTPFGSAWVGKFEGSVARLSARKLRRISKELTATNQKVGSSNLSGRATPF